ncbi:MAG: ATP-dependent Clp protease proteolytic subunit [Oscillospiraceae bacterium]|nr:ATP-dependent Clp protease proteolytic subunit [Oscillospiraceae bacterium]
MQDENLGEIHPPEEFPSKEQEQEETSKTEQQLNESEMIEDTGSIRPQNAKHLIHCLTVIGQVEGHYELSSQNKTTKYEHIIPALVAIEQDRSIEGLLILLNTVGGDVEAGLAIAELIAGMQTPTVSLVVGGGHSIGVPLSVSAKKSYIVPSASMTIHPVRMSGMMLGVPQSFSYISKIQDRIISFVTRNSHISEKQFRSLMTNTKELATDVGTVISGEQAVEMGLIDEMGGLSDAIASLYQLIETSPARYPDSL